MARIRTIKPEFPQSETIGRLSRDARLLFIQLWTIADDEGRTRAASRMLASLLYPYDDDAPRLIGKWLTELERENCIRRYEIEGTHYLDIPNWQKHQKIDRPSASRLPPFIASPRESSRDFDALPSTLDLGSSTLEANASCAIGKPTRTERDQKFAEFKKAYPKRDGGNPWPPARKLFEAAIKAGTDPDLIISAARNCVGIDKDRVGTQFVPQAQKWLRARCYEDFLPPREKTEIEKYQELHPGWRPGLPTHEELMEKYSGHEKSNSEEVFPNGGGLHSKTTAGS